ncbi:small G protein signaling modulator 1 [Heterodontus francisci]|uniref:small G protein signaling modulator 1 n=1 Tax=Heterodontus francisci TaxID=7792 RepID=UPI00355C7533
MATATAEAEMRQRLLRTVKKEVKQIMEEAVTRKFVHEDSSHIISFCAAVEACVLHGLKRRAAGFLRSNKIAALFMKVAKTFPLAEELCRKVQELEQLIESRKTQGAAPQENVRKSQKVPNLSAQAVKHLWIRTALFEKVLDKIVQHLVENSSKYYEKEALLMDPVDGPILGSLLALAPLKMLCDNMKYQILSRAFYGWLAYCRHLSTVRTHLSALVNHTIISPAAPSNAGCGLTREIWLTFLQDKKSYEEQELLRLIYYGGIEMEIRKEVWPFLLGHYQFGMTEVERKEVDDQIRTCYEQTMGEWMACEAVVRQRERESHAAALAKCSSAVSLDTQMQRMMHRDSTFSNESSQSCGSDSQNHVRLQSDSSTSTQVFESVEEAEGEQVEKEVETDNDKQAVPIPNGTVPNGTCSPDSGHPSSRNFSTTSGYSERSFSTEEVMQCSQHTMAHRRGSAVNKAEEIFPPQEELQEKVPPLEWLPEVLPTADGSKALPVVDRSEQSLPVVDGSEQVVPLVEGSEEVVPLVKGSEEVVPLVKGSEEVVPVAEGSEEVVPLAEGSEEVIPMAEGSKEVIPLAEGSEEVVPMAEGSKEVAPVAEGSKEVIPVAEGSEEVAPVAEGSKEVIPMAEGSEEVVPMAEGSKEVVLLMEGSEEVIPVVDGLDPDCEESKGDLPMFKTKENVTEQEIVGQEEALPVGQDMEGFCQQLSMAESNAHATSPVSSTGVTYAQELLDLYTVNLHRIEKDVQRCDRNYWYFTPTNLEKLRNVMCSYIWQHLEIGYVQGMCDLLAPLLVVLDDEAMAFSCFTQLMKRMNQNFPHGGAMDTHFANMRSLIQILDSELFELMHQNGDYTHFYFCYRWFLLDFKRELVYGDVFSVWETVWAAKYTSSAHFVLFIALSLVELYRDIILENNMDFTDIIKFFNEMAEHHDAKQVLKLARDLVYKVQTLIENK